MRAPMPCPCRALIAGIVLTCTPVALAAELGPSGEGPTIEMHGFVSQGAIKTTGNNYLIANSKRGSLEYAELGANVSGQLTDRLRVGFQLFASKLGTTGNFNVKADWFNLDYRWRDWLGLRAGRVKLPFGLYNDTSDIDAARVPVLLPQSVYPLADRDFLLAQTGLELYGFINLASAGALEYRVYGGTVYVPLSAPSPGAPYQVTALNADYVGGGRLFWDTPLDGLRVGASVQALRFSGTLSFPMTASLPTEVVTAHVPALLWVGSLEYAAHDWLAAVEYSQWHSKIADSSDPSRFPNFDSDDHRGYALVAYRVRRWFQPGAYYSLLIDVIHSPQGTTRTSQHDFAGTLRFDINDFWLVKLEGHYMHGTAGVDLDLNPGVTANAIVRNWAVFLLKTTAYF
ncbi:MAG TPA: hypothetical protein VIU64_11080 [Polyangia bacterium]